MKNSLALFLFHSIWLLSGCATPAPIAVPQEARETQIKACLPNAIMLAEGMKKVGIQAKVLSIHTVGNGHAVCAYLYPQGQNTLWVWDADWGSIQATAYWDNPWQIAQSWMLKKGDYSQLIQAEFRQ